MTRGVIFRVGYLQMGNRLGGTVTGRPLQFIWLADCSSSMWGKKIEALNFGVREALPAMCDVANDNPQAQVMVRAIRFSDGAHWHVAEPTSVHDFAWTDLGITGLTDMGQALSLAASALSSDQMPERGLAPVLVLLTDGHPTDDFERGLKELMAQRWGEKAVRIAIAIGEDVNLDVLKQFTGHEERVIQVHDVETLVRMIKWASTVPLQAASKPASQPMGMAPQADNIAVPAPPPVDDDAAIGAADVF